MKLLLVIRSDPVLNRWCSTQVRDYEFNIDGLRHALKTYPEGERSFVEQGILLGERIVSEAGRELEQTIKQATEDGWRYAK